MFFLMGRKKAAKVVSSAILGMDFKTIIVNGKVYIIKPPTIHQIAGAGYYLADLTEGDSVSDMLGMMKDIGGAAHALSYLINDNDSLSEELSKGTLEEVINGIHEGLDLISVQNFMMLSHLAKNVAMLTAKAK